VATAGGARGSGPERAWHPTLTEDGEVVLDPQESAHLVRSRRARVGDAVVLFDGRGATRAAEVVTADPRAARLRLAGPAPDRTPRLALHLAVSLPEMGRADRMIATLAELGVAVLAPLEAARTPAGRTVQAERRGERWARLAREACKVNGCARALVVEAPLTLASALAAGAVLLDPDPAVPDLARNVGQVHAARWLVVGPEGGFTAEEIAAAAGAGAFVARLGAPALRIETAAVAAAAVVLAAASGGAVSP